MLTSTLATALWQQQDTISGPSARYLIIFICIAAVALFGQFIVMIVIAVGAAKAQKQIMEHIDHFSGKLSPLLEKSTVIVTELAPQINKIAGHAQVISAHVEDISGVVREKVNEFAPTISAANETIREANDTVLDANRRTQEQVARVNGMVTSVLDATASVGRAVYTGISTPVREVSSILDGVKAGILTFINGNPRPRR